MKRTIKVLSAIALISIISFFAVRYYAYNAGKRDIQSEDTAFNVSAKNITQEFVSNGDISNKKYLEKPVAVSGIVTSITGNYIIIDDSVNCNLLKADTSVTNGQSVTIKGRVIGFDDLLGEVKLDQCSISTNK